MENGTQNDIKRQRERKRESKEEREHDDVQFGTSGKKQAKG